MYYHHDPDEYEAISTSVVCEFHKNNPGKMTPICMCSGSWGLRRRSPEEVAQIKNERRLREEDKILARAEIIKAARLIKFQE
jgi:hypothetical protein